MRWWDVPGLLPLERMLFPDDPWSEAGFWSELAGVPATRYYVVAENAAGSSPAPGGAALVGYAGLMAVQGEADVQTVGVAPSHQGHGLGRLLVTDLLDEARRRRCGQVLLEVRHDNVAAKRLYASLGFEQISVRRGYYGKHGDAHVLRLRLVP